MNTSLRRFSLRLSLVAMILCLYAALPGQGLTWAERIDVATARKVAESVAQREGAIGGLRSASELALVYAAAPGQSGSALRSGQVEGAADYFVFNFPGGKGFAIVSGDDRVRPVLGYSDEGSFDPDNLPENLRGWLAGYQDQITWAISKDIEATPEIAAEWSRHMSGTTLRATEGTVLLETAKWSQHEPYNLQTPMINGEHAVTGCVATAMGIIMKYHEYPAQAVNPPASNEYTVNGVKTSSQITYDAYDWDNMLDAYYNVSYDNKQANAVAKLLWHCGANVQMSYGLRSSGAYTLFAAKALSEVFGYSPSIRYLQKEAYRWEEWKEMLKTELADGYPVIYGGTSPVIGEGGHAVVCDGYSADGTFHINWGWDGVLNGFYLLSVLDDDGDGDGYSLNQDMILNIRPEKSGEKYRIRPYVELADYQIAGNSVTANFSCLYVGWEAATCYFGLGMVDENNKIIQKPLNYTSIALEAVALNENLEMPIPLIGVPCSGDWSNLSAGQRIVLCCSFDKSEWEVVRTSTTTKDLPVGVDHQGNVIYSSVDTPIEPEQPINVGILWNELDGAYAKYMKVTGLDNSAENKSNTKGLCFWINKPGGVWRYQIQEYAQWKDKIVIYKGKYKEELLKAGNGTPVQIAPDGTFDIPMDEILWKGGNTYTYYLKVLSKQAGELTYDLQAIPGPDETPVFEKKGNKIIFSGTSTGVTGSMDIIYDPTEIRGTVNQEIPFGVKFRNISNPALVGEDLTFDIIMGITGAEKEQIQLLDEAGNEIELSYHPTSTKLVKADNVSVGKLTADKLYSFKLKWGTKMEGTEARYFRATPKVNGVTITTKGISDAHIIIDPATTVKTYTVTPRFTNLKWADGTETVIEENKPFDCQLICEKEGYRLPASIKVTMGGNTLVAGTDYTYSNGGIHIKTVTGDIVIEAKAEQITHKVSIQQQDNLDVDVAKETSVTEGSGFAVKLTAKEGFLLPETVIVKTGEETTLTAGTDYTYTVSDDRKSGEIKINAVNRDLQIYAIGVPEPKIFTITGKLTDLTSNPDITKGVSVTENESYTFTLEAATDYRLPDAITVTPSTIKYEYDKETGKVVIGQVTENITVTAIAVDDHHYPVILKPGEGIVATPNAIEQLFTAGKKATFNAKFTASEGYIYNGSIEVTMGNETLVAGTDYTYDKKSGAFALLKGINATLTISTANGTKEQYTVSVKAGENLTFDFTEGGKEVAHGDPLTVKFTPKEGYNLPETVTMTMGGTELTEGYTYDKANGTVSIAKVTGDVVVTAEGVLKQYDVTLNLTNLTVTSKVNAVTHGDPLTLTLEPDDGYNLPKAVTVTMGGNTLTDTYKQADGTVSIAKVTGDVVVTAVADKIYKVEEEVTNLTIKASKDTIVKGETFTATLKEAEGYKLPYAITVTMGGRLLKQKRSDLKAAITEYYTYNNETGVVKIENVDGEIIIKAKGIQEGYFEVVLNLTNLTSSPASFEPQAQDAKVELTLTASSGYELPSGITVVMGEKALAVGTDYTYDRSTGKFSLEKITGTLVITASGSRIPDPEPEPEPTPTPVPTPVTYTVTLPVVEGATIAATGSTTVEKGNSLSFTVEVKAGYNADNMVVKANGTILTPDAAGRYTIADIRSNVVVTVSGIVKGDGPTANQEIESGELRVWASGSRLFIRTPEAERAYIVTFDGRVYKTLSLSAGEYSEQMPQGSYIIRVGTRSYKLSF